MIDNDLAAHIADYFRCGAAKEDMMNQFVRINQQHVVNMNNVTELYLTHRAGLGCSRTAIIINFSSDTPLTIYDDTDGYMALLAWMDSMPNFDAFLSPIPVLMEDAPLHRDSNSLCGDTTCPCFDEEGVR